VEFEDTYSEENIIAAAATDVTISREEAARLSESEPVITYDEPLLTETVRDHFKASGNGSLLDADGKDTVLASYAKTSYFKDNNGIRPVTMTILYGRSNTNTDDSYFYDICSSSQSGNSFISQSDVWQFSLYYNGKSAKPHGKTSHFTYSQLFDHTNKNDGNSWAYVFPFSAVNGRTTVKGSADKIGTDLITVKHGNYSASVYAPFSDKDALSMRLYFDPSMLFSGNGQLELYSVVMSSPAIFDMNDVTASDDVIAKIDLEIENAELQRQIAEGQAKAAENVHKASEAQKIAEEAANKALAENAIIAGEDVRYKSEEEIQQRISEEQRKIEENLTEMPTHN
jgi:hypothetical protein